MNCKNPKPCGNYNCTYSASATAKDILTYMTGVFVGSDADDVISLKGKCNELISLIYSDEFSDLSKKTRIAKIDAVRMKLIDSVQSTGLDTSYRKWIQQRIDVKHGSKTSTI